jgi:hypothetical protein
MTEPVIPTVISPQQAADALGIAIEELAENINLAVQNRLAKTAARVRSFELTNIDDFDYLIAETRRLFESLLSCYAVIDAVGEDAGHVELEDET